MSTADWNRRHGYIVKLLWLHSIGLFVLALAMGMDVIHASIEASVIAVGALAVKIPGLKRRQRSAIGAASLMLTSAILVHITGGATESHFHFFVMIGVVSLYQDWIAFFVASTFVLFQHGVLGVLDPRSVYNHQAAWDHPWTWAGIHALFVAGACSVSFLIWKLNESQALRDALTELPNTKLFRERLDQALARNQRNGAHLALFVVDVDNFKLINDGRGHVIGDEVLVELSKRLSNCLRQGDTAARLGGDEFGLVVEGMSTAKGAYVVARRILRCLEEPINSSGTDFFISCSVGVAFAEADDDVESLLKKADVAMYAAKSGGKGRFEMFDAGMYEEALAQAKLEADLVGSVRRNELKLQFQPIFDLTNDRVVGFESLVRWQHPELGLLYPISFIELAEQSSEIFEIGRWVLSESCRVAKRWQTEYSNPELAVSVNLSVRQFEDPDLVVTVSDALAESLLAPECLTLEITESVLMTDLQVGKIEELKRLGIRLAIDDFGTGYSSLSYLHRFALDEIKIDRSIINNLAGDVQGAAICEAIIQMSRALNMSVVAEGIEKESQSDKLRALGCGHGQGFLLAKPLDGPVMEDFLKDQAVTRAATV